MKGINNMDWIEITVKTTSEAIEAVANILMEHDATGVQIEDYKDYQNLNPDGIGPYGEIIDPDSFEHIHNGATITAYFPENVDITAKVAAVKAATLNLANFGINPGNVEVVQSALKDNDWATAWEKYYHPINITRYLTIVPEWEDYQPQKPGELIIRLDPGMAFGTGSHPTTKLALQALEMTIDNHKTMIDVGTGSGVLGLAARLMGVDSVLAYDVDEVAVESAKKNLALNPEVTGIEVAANDLLTGIHEQVDLIVANILAEIIVPLVPQAWDNLKAGGIFITSGIINDKLALIKEELTKRGFVITEVLNIGDWYSVIAQKPVASED